MGRLEGKAAVILGAASPGNMGQVMARSFAREGAKVMVAGRKEEPLRAIAAEIGGEYALCDITSRSQGRAMADAAVGKFGRVDAAINCTGWVAFWAMKSARVESITGGSSVTIEIPNSAISSRWAAIRSRTAS